MQDFYFFSLICIYILYIFYKDGMFSKSAKDTRTEAQKEYDRFMEMSGNYDNDEDDIESNRKWRNKVYGK